MFIVLVVGFTRGGLRDAFFIESSKVNKQEEQKKKKKKKVRKKQNMKP